MFTNRLLLRSLLLSFFPSLFLSLLPFSLSLLLPFFVRLRVQSHPSSSSRGVNAKKQNQNQRTDRIETLVRSIGREQSVLARITSAKWCIPSWCLAKRINLPNNFQYIVYREAFDSISLRFFSFSFFFLSLYFLRSVSRLLFQPTSRDNQEIYIFAASSRSRRIFISRYDLS